MWSFADTQRELKLIQKAGYKGLTKDHSYVYYISETSLILGHASQSCVIVYDYAITGGSFLNELDLVKINA